MEWQSDAYVIGLMFTTLASLGIASTALQHRERSGAQPLGLTVLSLCVWIIAYIFERFFRGRITDSGQIPGADLGLDVAQSIVAAHKGGIGLVGSTQGTKVTAWVSAVAPAEGG